MINGYTIRGKGVYDIITYSPVPYILLIDGVKYASFLPGHNTYRLSNPEGQEPVVDILPYSSDNKIRVDRIPERMPTSYGAATIEILIERVVSLENTVAELKEKLDKIKGVL